MGFVMSNLAWSFGSLVWDSAVPHVWQQPGDQQLLQQEQEQEQGDVSPLSMKDASTLAPLAWRRISGIPQGSKESTSYAQKRPENSRGAQICQKNSAKGPYHAQSNSDHGTFCVAVCV